MSSLPFNFKDLAPATSSWGPQGDVPQSLRFSDVPYAPFSKSDKLGKAADWQSAKDAAAMQTAQTKNQKQFQRGQRDQYHAYGASAAASFAAEEEEAGEFLVVDNTAPPVGARQTLTLRGKKTIGGKPAPFDRNAKGQTGNKYQNNNANNNNNNSQRPQNFRGYNNTNRWNRFKDDSAAKRAPSVKVGSEWKLITEVEFNRLSKLNLDVKDVQDVDTYGTLNYYNKKFEKLNGTLSQPLQTLDRAIFNPSTQDDPIISSLADSKAAQIFATDGILAQLMCAYRSVYSWDIVVRKKNGVIFFDKRDGSTVDRLDVDENAPNPPIENIETDTNSADNLSLEATFINQNFVANSLLESSKFTLKHAENPFVSQADVAEPLLNRGYKYRKFVLPSSDASAEPMSIIVRTEIDATDKQPNGETSFVSINALNQYTPGTLDWKTKLNQQRGAIIAAELKRNNNKISRWTTKSILGGCDTMKIGFVARVLPKDNTKHVVLGVNTYKPLDLAAQINLSVNNGWGIVKSLIEIVEHESGSEDYKYVILKDPNSPKISIYHVPLDTFEETGGLEEESEE
ncbi:unnamed protein product [Kuraishia capsulata CBS 1993]|uniref:Eukaryotic translation initiation factor 3 subunit D n=1 Tax=Kuraishia capsulata CBS 1993 TaxID=1382522 RepID=W6MLI9_9ASCO|nr:uncharacterized protein KUCA_T00001662001 [Kuraishia capsulata CBS 1993]CDK25692.1 unnamed protein product [Kuraishia capsulata CBS 1993]